MIETIGYFITIALVIFIGYLAGYLSAKKHSEHLLKLEEKHHAESLESAEARYMQGLKDISKIFRTEQQETAKRHTKLLDEIAQVTGVDVVELPSFGTVYLNHSKNVREAMQALHEEDLSDGALE